MTTRFYVRMSRLVLAAGLVALVGSQTAIAQEFPAKFQYKCLADKQKAAGKYCLGVLKAWSKWDKLQDDTKRNDAITKAAGKLDGQWAKAEEKASLKGIDCSISTETYTGMKALIDAAAAAIKDDINDGLELGVGNKDHEKCGLKLLKAAGVKCLKYLKAESLFLKKLQKDPAGLKRDELQEKASGKFGDAWTKAGGGGLSCPTTATVGGVETSVDALSDAVVLGTTVSPSVPDDSFMVISPTGTTEYEGRSLTPTCIFSTDYHFFAKRGSVNKLLMYYEGGGACWEQLTCSLPVCKIEVDPVGGNPGNFGSGLGDWDNPANPFYGWSVVYVPYCTCDVHFGDSAQDYPLHAEHRGFHNAKVAEKWAREHFVNPEQIFVTGSSAGAYGAIFQAPLLHAVWPASDFSVLGDAGNGVITQDFLENEFENWNFRSNLPDYIPGVLESMGVGGLGMPAYVEAVADFFPNTNWAHYTAAYDGGSGGQTGFYNVMLNGNNPIFALTWWQASCAWNTVMTQQAIDTYNAVELDNGNYRYYIASGSKHTGFGGDRAYTDTTGGVPLLVDWINGMIDDTPAWTNAEAVPNNVLFSGACSAGSDNPGDPCGCDSDCPNGQCEGEDVQPCPPTAPFEKVGDVMVVACSPSGAFLGLEGGALD